MRHFHIKQISTIICLFLLICVSGCASDMPQAYEKDEWNTVYSDSKILSLLEKFYYEIHPDSRASLPGLRIRDIKEQMYSLKENVGEEAVVTRTDLEDEFYLYTITMDFEENSGFAVVAEGSGLERVFFFTEAGEISDTAYKAPLKDLIEVYPSIAADMILDENPTRASQNGYEDTFIDDIVRCKWGQGYPFNNCAPYCTCNKCSARGNHQLAGCVTIAVGQYLATRGNFSGSYYPNNNLDFTNFPAYGSHMSDYQKAIVANFLREIAHNCQIKFGCDGTSGQLKAVVNYMKELGIDCWFADELTPDCIATELSKGIPHLIRGEHSGSGHEWLVTGMKYQTDISTGKISNYTYHCNWGWGGECNGWTIGNYYTPVSTASTPHPNPYPSKIDHMYTNEW